MCRCRSIFKVGEKRATSSKKWVMSPIWWSLYGVLLHLDFLLSYQIWWIMKISHFVKVTSSEGHHHLAFDVRLVQEFPYIYWMNFKLCFWCRQGGMNVIYENIEIFVYCTFNWNHDNKLFISEFLYIRFFLNIEPNTYYHIAFCICILCN